jgi:hypothetical protein
MESAELKRNQAGARHSGLVRLNDNFTLIFFCIGFETLRQFFLKNKITSGNEKKNPMRET